jgi:hypothetical protein
MRFRAHFGVIRRVSAPLAVDVDGRDVTNQFTPRSDGNLEGLLTGLRVGTNVLRFASPAATARVSC